MPLELTGPVVGLSVWAGSYLPWRRMLHDRSRADAASFAALFGVAAFLAWTADPWFRAAVVGICAGFVVFSAAVLGIERVTERD